MASLMHFMLVSATLCLCVLSNPVTCTTSTTSGRLYVFGDAVFDAGNSAYNNPSSAYSKLPYGMSLQNQSYGTGRISDGLLIPDYIASFANLGVIPPSKKVSASFKNGVNFASSSAGALDMPNRMNFKQQLESFMSVVEKSKAEIGAAETRKMLGNSVFLIGFGGADYLDYFGKSPKASAADKTAFANKVTASISTSVFNIYRQGGRKFAFTNVMALGCIPAIKESKNIGKTQCCEPLNDLPRQHNIALVNAAKKLQLQLPNFNYTIFDLYTTLHNRMINPTKFGFEEGDNKACCGRGERRGGSCGSKPFDLCPDPSKFVFFDGYMTSQETHLQLATRFWSGGADVASPYNLKSFFSGSLVTSTTPSTDFVLDQSA